MMADDRFNGTYSISLSTWAPDKKEMKPGVLYMATCDAAKTRPEDAIGVHFMCPCGCCRMPVYLPIQHGPAPNEHRWGFTVTDGIVTITPSILERFGCKSHYFITGGMVQWC